MTNKRVRVVLVDDHVIVREGLEGLIRKDESLDVVASVGSGAQALQVCREEDVDVVLLDLRMPDMDGAETLRRMRAEHPTLPILILTSDNRDESVRRTMALGASGFLLKSVRSRELADSLKWAVQHGRLPLAPDLAARLHAGDTQDTLTPREHEILREMARGASNEDIAGTMGVSLSTVKTHVNKVMVKLGASTRTGAVVVAARSGLIDVD